MKRKIISYDDCIRDLSRELPLLFNVFECAIEMFNKEIVATPPEARARAFEAGLLNSKMIQCAQKSFPDNWKFGKHKRFILRVEGYTILFKKLDRNHRPMNINTVFADAIANQKQFELFDDSHGTTDPIIFFGYKKDRFGVVSDPEVVYIDEDKVKWIVTSDSISKDRIAFVKDGNKQELAIPKIKVAKRKVSNG
jgi:hypothetical protein